jgi:hypothetical protein
MLSDPQSITYATVAKSLPKVGGDSPTSATYKMNDGTRTFQLVTSNAFKRRNRAVARLTVDSFVTDPLIPANSIAAGATATFTVDFPTSGLLPADVQNIVNCLTGWLTSAVALRLINGEI